MHVDLCWFIIPWSSLMWPKDYLNMCHIFYYNFSVNFLQITWIRPQKCFQTKILDGDITCQSPSSKHYHFKRQRYVGQSVLSALSQWHDTIHLQKKGSEGVFVECYCDKGCVHAYFAKAESAFWNADSKRRSKTPLIQAIVRAQVNRKGIYMTSFKRGYNVILRSCFHQNQRFALTTIVNAHFWAAFMLILRRRFETLIQNADPKRRSRKYCSCFPREEDDTFTEEGMSRNSQNV